MDGDFAIRARVPGADGNERRKVSVNLFTGLIRAYLQFPTTSREPAPLDGLQNHDPSKSHLLFIIFRSI